MKNKFDLLNGHVNSSQIICRSYDGLDHNIDGCAHVRSCFYLSQSIRIVNMNTIQSMSHCEVQVVAITIPINKLNLSKLNWKLAFHIYDFLNCRSSKEKKIASQYYSSLFIYFKGYFGKYYLLAFASRNEIDEMSLWT